MEIKLNAKLLGYVGFGLLVIGLLIPFVKIAFFGGLGLVFDMGKLGELNGLMYLVSLLAIAVTAYGGYVSFKSEKDLKMAGYAAAGMFVVLLVAFFICKGSVTRQTGDFGNLVGMVFKMGLATWMFLAAAVAYLFADRQPNEVPMETESTEENI